MKSKNNKKVEADEVIKEVGMFNDFVVMEKEKKTKKNRKNRYE